MRRLKFLKLYDTILEQDDAPVEEVPVEEVPVEEPPAAEPEVATLSPESEVLLVRLLKKAIVTTIEAEDVDTIAGLDDINEVNAKETLSMLIRIMQKYSTDIDIDA
tara:strand:- start:1527 stop:1844 length:318 start_codon:yes stop_codon:yes gene_type:complete